MRVLAGFVCVVGLRVLCFEKTRNPEQWDDLDNPPYSYYSYYMSVQFARFSFLPVCA